MKYPVTSAVAIVEDPGEGQASHESSVTIALGDADRGCDDTKRAWSVLYSSNPYANQLAPLPDGAVLIAVTSGTQIDHGPVAQWLVGTTQVGEIGEATLNGAFGKYATQTQGFETTPIKEGYVTVDKIAGGFVDGKYYLRSGDLVLEGPLHARICPL
jgi:hypothetical protein